MSPYSSSLLASLENPKSTHHLCVTYREISFPRFKLYSLSPSPCPPQNPRNFGSGIQQPLPVGQGHWFIFPLVLLSSSSPLQIQHLVDGCCNVVFSSAVDETTSMKLRTSIPRPSDFTSCLSSTSNMKDTWNCSGWKCATTSLAFYHQTAF